ncbi:hypothetical protein KO361_03760 [Candidatus Woesearchaeota archaeon]|nr:hypothetical protein [Candidatus Woesearchaeota archaeon]
MNKLSRIISSLSEEDLLKIKRDLVAGNVDRLVEMRLSEFQEVKFSSKQCPVCGGKITNDSFVLEFGKSYIRRRAFFDGLDCLEYFVSVKLKKEDLKEVHD